MVSSKVFVVGVDDSSECRAVLEYAVAEAILHGATLRVVSAFESLGVFGARYGMPIPVSDQQVTEAVESQTLELIKDVVAALPEPPPVHVVVRAGATGRVLTDVADGADMLIIGHSGHGAISSALLGSVGLHCVLHARCPVTVLRPHSGVSTEPVTANAAVAIA